MQIEKNKYVTKSEFQSFVLWEMLPSKRFVSHTKPVLGAQVWTHVEGEKQTK